MSLFWQKYPALHYSLFFLLGCYFAIEQSWMVLIPLAFLIATQWPFSKKSLSRLSLGLAIGLLAAISVHARFSLPELPPEGRSERFEFQIESLTQSKTHFGRCWVYRGWIRDGNAHTPCRVILPENRNIERPLADKSYMIKGRLVQKPHFHYQLLIDKFESWIPIDDSWSMAEYRYQAKCALGQFIQGCIKDQQPSLFLTGMATGEFDDKQLFFEFGRFGLQHIMAISGFHFSILSAVLAVMLGICLSRKYSIGLQVFLLCIYCIFLGSNPSIMRAWLAAMIVLLGLAFGKRACGLNSLGIAMLVILLYNPLLCMNIGFQFSFAATTGILLLFQKFDSLWQRIFPVRRLNEAASMSLVSQHGYLILSYFRQGLALTCAVNLITAPLVLFYFHKFAAMGLIYNLFFPLMVSVSLFLLITGSLVFLLIPPVGIWVHELNAHYTRFVLNYTYNMPSTLDIIWRVNEYPAALLVCVLSFIVFIPIYLETRHAEHLDIS